VSDNKSVKVLIVDIPPQPEKPADPLQKGGGHPVPTAEDGFSALSKVMSFKPDVIFLDIMMPRLDGYQVCSVIKSNAAFAKTPVLMLSSKDSIFDKARGRIAGSEYFMTKPFSRDELLNAIRTHVQ